MSMMKPNEAERKQIIIANRKKFEGFLEKMKGDLAKVLPGYMNADRMSRIALTEYRKTPKLAECDPATVAGSIMVAASLGLEPGLLDHCYLVPHWNGKTKQLECKLYLGYKGMIDLSRRSGQIVSIIAHMVHANDEFQFEYGLTEKLYHKPALTNRGDIIAGYAVAKLQGGGHAFLVMSKAELDDVKKYSKDQRDDNLWTTQFDAMARKTLVRRLFKWLPCSIQMQKAAILDEQAEIGIQDIKAAVAEEIEPNIVNEFWEGTAETIDNETGEVKTQAENLADKI